MATQKPISTISYNTEKFLKEKLEEWKDAHIISCYQYIKHVGEDGDKDHIHLRIEPNKRIDPMQLQAELREFQIGKEKPLGCRPFRFSKEEDWYLYSVHDKEYLKLKYGGGEKGEKLPYKWKDIIVPDDYDLEIAFIRAKAKLQHTSVNMATRLQEGENPLSLILQGENVHIVNALVRALNMTDYERLQEEIKVLQSRITAIFVALEKAGFLIVEEETEVKIIDKKTGEVLP